MKLQDSRLISELSLSRSVEIDKTALKIIKDGQSQYVVTFESSQEVPIEAGAEYYVDVISQAGDSVSAPVGRQLLTGIIGISESQTCSTLV